MLTSSFLAKTVGGNVDNICQKKKSLEELGGLFSFRKFFASFFKKEALLLVSRFCFEDRCALRILQASQPEGRQRGKALR